MVTNQVYYETQISLRKIQCPTASVKSSLTIILTMNFVSMYYCALCMFSIDSTQIGLSLFPKADYSFICPQHQEFISSDFFDCTFCMFSIDSTSIGLSLFHKADYSFICLQHQEFIFQVIFYGGEILLMFQKIKVLLRMSLIRYDCGLDLLLMVLSYILQIKICKFTSKIQKV